MTKVQFASRLEPDGTWAVYDVVSGKPAKLNGQFCCGLKRADADDIAAYLNRWEDSR